MQKKNFKNILLSNSERNHSGKITVRHRASGVNREVSIVNSFSKVSGVKCLIFNHKKDSLKNIKYNLFINYNFLRNNKYNIVIYQKKNFVTVATTELIIIGVTDDNFGNTAVILFVSFFGSKRNTSKDNGSSSGSGDSGSDDDKDNNNKNLTQTNTSENDWLSYLNDFYKNHKMAIWIAGGITITLTLAVSAYYFRDEIQAFLFGNKCSAPREEILEDVNNSTALNTAPATDINVTEPEQSISTVEEVNPIIAETNITVPVLNLPDQLRDLEDFYLNNFVPYYIRKGTGEIIPALRDQELLKAARGFLNSLPDQSILSNSYRDIVKILIDNGETKGISEKSLRILINCLDETKLGILNKLMQSDLASNKLINFEINTALTRIVDQSDVDAISAHIREIIRDVYINSLHIHEETPTGLKLIETLNLNKEVITNMSADFLDWTDFLFVQFSAAIQVGNLERVKTLGLLLGQTFDAQFGALSHPLVFSRITK